MKKLLLLLTLFLSAFLFVQRAEATNYFVDFSAAAGGNGLASSTAWNNIDSFTEVARSAGDQVFVRRGQATSSFISDVNFTSSGARNNPLVVSADYDNIWGDFANSAQTYTVTQASTTMSASATITGIAAGDWIYVVGDHTETPGAPTAFNKPYAYEVRSVSGTTLTLYLPYQGSSSGSGKTLRVMPDNPDWALTTSDFQWVLSSDDFWHIYGIRINSTDAVCAITMSGSDGLFLRDLILEGNGSGDCGLANGTQSSYLTKSRIHFVVTGISAPQGISLSYLYVDCNSVASARAILDTGGTLGYFNNASNSVFANCAFDVNFSATAGSTMVFRNVDGNKTFTGLNSAANSRRVFIEDEDQVQGVNRYVDNFLSAYSGSNPFYTSTTTVVRTGGADKSLYFDNTNALATAYGTTSPASAMQLFGVSNIFGDGGYPIYLNTATTTISVYFRSGATGNWTANPTNEELWIEAEYYGSTDNNWRLTKKSTGTLNFTGSTDWAALSVEVKPAKAGIVYLRAWYAKAKETGKINDFYVDIKPVLTQ